MAEHEGKADSEICFSCKFFDPIISVHYKTGEVSKTKYGWCKKRPRLNQKHDDRTNATDWCQYYEAKMDKRKLLEDAIQMINPDPSAPITLTSEERDAISERLETKIAIEEAMKMDDGKDADAVENYGRTPYEDGEEVAATGSPYEMEHHIINEYVRNELAVLTKELAQFQHNAERQLIDVALSGDNLLLMETKGMLRTATLFRAQIEARIKSLTPSSDEEAPPIFAPHRGDAK